MDQWISLVAALATIIAAIMTAANLGTRVTGWGFVIFTVGAYAWTIDAALTHQTSLLWSNAFLAIVDAIGIYRWLGRRARLEDGADAAAGKSRTEHRPLFPVFALEGSSLHGRDGFEVAHIVGAMADCRSGKIDWWSRRAASPRASNSGRSPGRTSRAEKPSERHSRGQNFPRCRSSTPRIGPPRFGPPSIATDERLKPPENSNLIPLATPLAEPWVL